MLVLCSSSVRTPERKPVCNTVALDVHYECHTSAGSNLRYSVSGQGQRLDVSGAVRELCLKVVVFTVFVSISCSELF